MKVELLITMIRELELGRREILIDLITKGMSSRMRKWRFGKVVLLIEKNDQIYTQPGRS